MKLKIQQEWYVCPECEAIVLYTDDDGCCLTCGAECALKMCTVRIKVIKLRSNHDR